MGGMIPSRIMVFLDRRRSGPGRVTRYEDASLGVDAESLPTIFSNNKENT